MTTLADRVPVDSITAQAKQVRPGRAVLTFIAAMLFGLGWVTSRVFAVAWLGFAWSWTAVRVGWESGHGPSRRKQLEVAQELAEHWETVAKRMGA
jgi:hypothetical protein